MTTDTRPGCLFSFLRLLSFSKAPTAEVSNDTTADAADAPADVIPESLPYRVRDDFLSPAELSFYHVLRLVAGPQAMVLAKVGLADVLFVSRPHENAGARARISQKHVDFLVCDPHTMRPLAAIELDDASHARADRQQRDTFVDSAFQAAGLPLLRFAARHTYRTEDVASQLAPYLPSAADSQPAASAPKAADHPDDAQPGIAPLCPTCGIPMVLRTASRGERRGEQFFGCTNYPRCRAVAPGPT